MVQKILGKRNTCVWLSGRLHIKGRLNEGPRLQRKHKDDVSGTRFSMLDWVRVTGLSCTKGVWYMYDRDTGQLIRCKEGPYGPPLLFDVNYSV